jgi:hypothetical protein
MSDLPITVKERTEAVPQNVHEMKTADNRILSAPLKNGTACGKCEFSITLAGAAEANSPPLAAIPIVSIISFSEAIVKG